MESFLWYVSVLAIVIVGGYVFYSYFSGQMGGGAALVLVIVACTAFGFLMFVAAYLGGYRKAGWTPEQEARRGELAKRERPERSPSAVMPGLIQSESKYRTYKRIMLLLIVVGAVAIGFNPALGLLLIVMAGLSFAILRAVEIFEGPVES